MEQHLRPDSQWCVPNSAPQNTGISSDGEHRSRKTENTLGLAGKADKLNTDLGKYRRRWKTGKKEKINKKKNCS